MKNMDTVKLFQECDAGVKMAIASLNQVVDEVVDPTLKKLIMKSREHHEKLKEEIEEQLKLAGIDEKEPNPMAKGMSYLKTNFKMEMDGSDKTVTDLIIDGCNMGTKSLKDYKDRYPQANEKSVELCNKLIQIEEKLTQDLELREVPF